ncbi:MAG: hypothetical protein JO322_05690 [Candidatus Eremiobacteraeota bacterium]|nr:hypothetical protein [Candidatus Eremiobacteraeota bacterium]
MSFRNLLALTALVALAACGGGNNQSSSAASPTASSNGIMTNEAANPSPSTAANAPMGGMNASGEAMAPGTLATVPPGMTCGAVQPVWVNTKTHTYHVSSDPYYGRTKHGEYMCPSQAAKEGYHKAGGGKHHHASSSSDSDTQQ